jgi:WD40 repeat protein/soluble cytochrome b562
MHGDKLVVASLTDATSKETIALSDSLFARDFDALGDLAMLLCHPIEEIASPARLCIQVFDLAEKRLLLSLDLSAVADALASAETLMAPCRFHSVRLQPGRDSCQSLLASAQGMMIYPLLAFETGVPLVVPCPPAAGILNPSAPAIACRVFEIGREPETLLAGYANKVEGGEISIKGEFRVWDTKRLEDTPPQLLSAPVNGICQTPSGAVVVGTQDGEASSWRYDGEWKRLAIIEHGVPVVTVSCSDRGELICSASEDGNLMIWESRTGQPLLRTFLDIKPVAAGFIREDTGLCVVDRMGEAHVWRIENGDALINRSDHISTSPRESFDSEPDFPPSYMSQYLASAGAFECAKSQIEQGDFIRARETLSLIADTPAMALTKRDWLSRVDAAESLTGLSESVRQTLAEFRESSRKWMQGNRDWNEERKMSDCLKALTQEVRRLLEEGKEAEAGALIGAMPEAAPNYILKARRACLSLLKRIEARREFEADLNLIQRLAAEGRLDEARAAIEAIPDAYQEIAEIKRELLTRIDEVEQLRDTIAAAAQEGQELAQEGRLAEARWVIEKLPDVPDQVRELKKTLLRRIDEVEQQIVRQALQESRRFVEEAQFDRARQTIETIAGGSAEVEQLKKEALVWIDEVERLHTDVQLAIEECQRLIKHGRVAEARQVIERLPDLDDLTEVKTNFLSQVDEAQREYEKKEAEASSMLDCFEAIGLSREGIEALARQNDVDPANVWEFHAFLRAVTEQLPSALKARMKRAASGDEPEKRKWFHFWRR